MALPALRQPKLRQKAQPKSSNQDFVDEYVILTLKNENKLVVNSDAYHGILTNEDMYKCVFCETCMELDKDFMELHKKSVKHQTAMNEVPYVEECAEDLVRRLSKHQSYCTICNVTLPSFSVARHVYSESHRHEMAKATTRALAYKPYVLI